jgi:tRNA pseudouridine38-40 synthase
MTDPSADPGGSADARPAPFPSAVEVAPPAPGHERIRMLVAYDGSQFHGMAENEGVATVAGALRDVLERVLGHPVQLSVAGRTDTGVHAWGQVVSFDAVAEKADPDRLALAVNRQCGPAVVVRDASLAAPDFDARFSARTRRYRYTVLNRPVQDPFLAATSWWVPEPLELNALRLGCDALLGSHDFSSFCRRPKGGAEVSLVRRVLDARWVDLGEGVLRFDIEATAFCHQMVRSITGTLVDMGRGRRRAGEMASIVRAQARAVAGSIAPPHGLCLWDVLY